MYLWPDGNFQQGSRKKKKVEKNDDARNKDINYNSKFLDEIG